MKSLKKILAFVLSMVLVAGISVSGTLAFLQEADADVNVMTTGKVDIEQHEYQREVDADGNYVTDNIDNQTSYVLEAFQQGKPLLPATELDANGNPYNYGAGGWDNTTVRMSQVKSYGGMQVFTSKNAVDKFVVVENTGKTDAYIRTLVAIEIGTTDGSLFGTSHHQTWSKNEIGVITIDGNNYILFEYAYEGGELDDGTWRHKNGILPAGDTAYPSLSQVYLNAAATNEDVEKIDGNKNGTIDILVLSQAVQADGFADAETALNAGFGKTAEKAAEWFGGTHIPDLSKSTLVSSVDELTEALDKGENVVLRNDVTVSEDTSIPVKGDVVIDLAGNTLTMTANDNEAAAKAINVFTIANGQTVTIEGGEFVVNFNKNGTNYSNGNVMNCLFDVQAGGKLIINDGTFTATMVEDGYNLVPVIIDNNGEVEINGGTFSTNAINLFRNRNGKMTINGGTFSGTSYPQDKEKYPVSVIWNQYASSVLTVNGGTFTNLEIEKEAGTVSVAGGIDLPLWKPLNER